MTKPFRYFVRVRYQDCDSQHVVFNARYGDYIDLAITEFLAATMPERDPVTNIFEIQVKKQTIEWAAPAHFNDVIEITTAVSRMGNSSFDVTFEMRLAGTSDPIVTVTCLYVHVVDEGGGRWRSTPIPEGPRAQLLAGAKGKVIDHAGHFPITVGE